MQFNSVTPRFSDKGKLSASAGLLNAKQSHFLVEWIILGRSIWSAA